MRLVVSMIGGRAGQELWMQEHAAEAALATGAVALPDSDDAINVRARLGLDDKGVFQDKSARQEIRYARNKNEVHLVGDWPEHAIIPARLMLTNMVKMSEGGQITIAFDNKSAVYKGVRDVGGEMYADLEIDPHAPVPKQDDDSDKSVSKDVAGDDGKGGQEEKEIPKNWRSLHWKTKAKLAEKLTGEMPNSGSWANRILEAFSARK